MGNGIDMGREIIKIELGWMYNWNSFLCYNNCIRLNYIISNIVTSYVFFKSKLGGLK